MNDSDKKLAEQVELLTEIGVKRGRAWSISRACYSVGFKAGCRQQKLRDRKSANWEKYGAWYRCSRCGAPNVGRYGYCSRCGAVMKNTVEPGDGFNHGCHPGGVE